MGIGSFGWQKGVAIGLVFLGVYIVTQSKSKADFEKEGEGDIERKWNAKGRM